MCSAVPFRCLTAAIPLPFRLTDAERRSARTTPRASFRPAPIGAEAAVAPSQGSVHQTPATRQQAARDGRSNSMMAAAQTYERDATLVDWAWPAKATPQRYRYHSWRQLSTFPTVICPEGLLGAT